MRKSFKLILALLIAIFTLPVFGSAVFANENGQLEDGTYTIDYNLKHETEDKPSSADRFFVKPATLKVENGKTYVEIQVTGASMIKSLTTPNGEVDVISEDTENDSRVVGFELTSALSEVLEMGMTISTPMGEMNHTVRTYFDVDTLENTSQPVEENENNGLEEGFYTVKYQALHAEKDEPSTMSRFMVDTAFVSNHDGQLELTIAVANETVTKLQLNGQDPVESKVDGNTRHETFVLESLPTELEGYVEYQAPFRGSVHHGKADFRVVLDETSLETADEADKYAREFVAQPRPNPGNTNEESKETEVDKETENKEENNKEETKEPVKESEETATKNQFTPDKVYEINYVVKHATEDKDSAANQFFKKPAYLLENNGEKYIQLTVTNSDMIDSLRTANGDVVIVKENADGSMVIQFKVNDLNNPVHMDMHITVPGMYSMDHTARLFFDVDSMKEVDAGNHQIAPSTTDNGQAVNPQTGDNTNILLYVLLLIGSGIPLAFMLKRRFA